MDVTSIATQFLPAGITGMDICSLLHVEEGHHLPEGCSPIKWQRILPDDVACTTWSGPFEMQPLFAEEQIHVASMVSRRALEFSVGRYCAREAIRNLGGAHCPIPMRKDRSPVWPNGIVGSIAHCDRECIAIAARESDYLSVGIDVEVTNQLAAHPQRHFLTKQEVSFIELLTFGNQGDQKGARVDSKSVDWPTLFFSMKEAAYKAWHPIVGTMLDFLDVTVEIDTSHFDVATEAICLGRARISHASVGAEEGTFATEFMKRIEIRFASSSTHVSAVAWVRQN